MVEIRETGNLPQLEYIWTNFLPDENYNDKFLERIQYTLKPLYSGHHWYPAGSPV